MQRVVLIIAAPEDVHALAVARHVATFKDSRAVILDSAAYPAALRLSVTATVSEFRFSLRVSEDVIDSEQVVGVWWRRPRRHDVSAAVSSPPVRKFCHEESRAAFDGWLHSLETSVINPLAAETRSNHKVLQLRCAAGAGLTIPRTLITNSSEDVLSFYKETGVPLVFKALTGGRFQFIETRRLLTEHLVHLTALSHGPSIFQEEITNKIDIRVTIIDDKIFAAEILPRHPGAGLDWRLDASVEIRTHVLPVAVTNQLMRLMRLLGLRYGAIDLALRQDGSYVFLEVNPGGQYLFVEIHTELPISAALAQALCWSRSKVVDVPLPNPVG